MDESAKINEIEALQEEIDNLHQEIDAIDLQLAENLSWIAKANHARKVKCRMVSKLQVLIGDIKGR